MVTCATAPLETLSLVKVGAVPLPVAVLLSALPGAWHTKKGLLENVW